MATCPGVPHSVSSSNSGQGRVCGGPALAHFLRRFVQGELSLEEAAVLTGLQLATLRLYQASPLTVACGRFGE